MSNLKCKFALYEINVTLSYFINFQFFINKKVRILYSRIIDTFTFYIKKNVDELFLTVYSFIFIHVITY